MHAGRRELQRLSIVGVATLCAMLIAGAFKTGETARACAFIYPFIVWPLASGLRDAAKLQGRLPFLLLAQTLIMQLVGDYYW